MKLRSGCPN